MSSNSGYMSQLASVEAKLDLQQVGFVEKVGQAYEKTSALQTEASSQMNKKAKAAEDKQKAYAKVSMALGILGGVLAGAGVLFTGVSLFGSTDELLTEGSSLYNKFKGMSGKLGLVLSTLAPIGTKIYTADTDLKMAKDKAGIKLEEALASRSGDSSDELTKMMSSSLQLQASLTRGMADVISAYKQAEMV
ncbi:MAG: hypothetical protein P0S94_04760 [Simkaniaceae bacterium]|nr:hypothetical protein [Simkaniaceae bacterium]